MSSKRILSIATAVVLSLSACTSDPVAGDFKAPELGEATVEAEAFRVMIRCPVRGGTDGISDFGVRLMSETALKTLSATLESGTLQAEAKALEADTEYRAEIFIGNGAKEITRAVSFRTEAGPQTVEIPDPVFRSYIMDHFDLNGDEVLTVVEAQDIREIEVCTDSIYSLCGIEKMGQLVRLVADGSHWGNGHLWEVDLSGNPKLEYCHLESNRLSTVDLSCNPQLWNFSACVNPLDSIDFSHNPKLTEIGLNGTGMDHLPDMTFLPLRSLHMSELARFMPGDYLRQFPKLYSFNVGGFQGTALDLSGNPEIISIWCENAPNLEVLDFTAFTGPVLEHLHVENCPKLNKVVLRKGTTIQNIDKADHTEIVYTE